MQINNLYRHNHSPELIPLSVGAVDLSSEPMFSTTSLSSSERKKALLALLVVTSVWGATFIWMKQALNAVGSEIVAQGRFQIIAILVAARFLVAAIVMFFAFSRARTALREPEQWRGGLILRSLCASSLNGGRDPGGSCMWSPPVVARGFRSVHNLLLGRLRRQAKRMALLLGCCVFATCCQNDI